MYVLPSTPQTGLKILKRKVIETHTQIPQNFLYSGTSQVFLLQGHFPLQSLPTLAHFLTQLLA